MSNYSDGIGFTAGSSVPNGGNGFTGGSSRDEGASPFTKGYMFVFFAFPTTLFKQEGLSAKDARQHLLNAAKDFQPHADRQLNFVEDKGIGGTTANFLVGQQTSTEFNITFKEYMTTPIMRVLRKWTSYIDPYLGGTTVGNTFAPDEYKGSVMVIQTKPVARVDARDWKLSDIVKVDLYDGVCPSMDPSSVFGNNIESTERVEIPVPFKFDGQPLNELHAATLAQALAVLRSQDIYKNTQDIYNALGADNNIESGIIS